MEEDQELASLKYLDEEDIRQATLKSEREDGEEYNMIRIEDQNPTPA